MSLVSTKTHVLRRSAAILAGAALAGMLACGDDEAMGAAPCMMDADCQAVGEGYMCAMGSCVPPAGTSSTGEGSTTDESTSTGEMTGSTSSDTTDPTAVTSTTGPVENFDCDPDSAPFLVADTALPQASIGFDFAAMTCGAASLASAEPQLLLDVRQTGLVDATGFGLEITSSSVGTLFEDPSVGDSSVSGISPDIPITIVATSIADGTEVTIGFTISTSGPSLVGVTGEFGGA